MMETTVALLRTERMMVTKREILALLEASIRTMHMITMRLVTLEVLAVPGAMAMDTEVQSLNTVNTAD